MDFAIARRISSVVHTMLVTGVVMLLCRPAAAELDLNSATIEQLDNGLTVIVLEDRNFPVVSVQSLYRVGARNEVTGKTGLAHFLEHLAFRSSTNFPGTGLVSRIYAEGGEWHGYTWTDETTYFATVPAAHLELLLDIEADRMSHLTFAADVIGAERGAVLAEMHMYENDPNAVLIDALLFTVFVAHPYRNNTIGWESDVDALSYVDARQFYETHYHAANAVIAIVGDVDTETTLAAVRKRFDKLESRPPTPLPHTEEPVQSGVRRVQVTTGSDVRQFKIAYRAPSVSNPDFPAFLVLQEILASGSGVSFLQNDWGTPLADTGLLTGTADNLTTWFPPSAQDYVFVIGGTPRAASSEADTESAIEAQIANLRDTAPSSVDLAEAQARIHDELIYDVQTTEDAAHQLAFFAGLGGLDVLLSLPERVSQVSVDDVQRVANTYLGAAQRTIAWHLPGDPPLPATPAAAPTPAVALPSGAGIDEVAVPRPAVRRLANGLPVLIQASDLSSAVILKAVFHGSGASHPDAVANDPAAGFSSVSLFGRPSAMPDMIRKLERTMAGLRLSPDSDDDVAMDPATRLEQVFQRLIRPTGQAGTTLVPAFFVVSGDIMPTAVYEALDAAFGTMAVTDVKPVVTAAPIARETIHEHLGRDIAQAQIGYIASVGGPADPAADAVRLLLYALSHGYEGRLGTAAISDRGLAYYIDARYRTDGQNGWITLAIGVDPEKADALRELLLAELQALRDDPPGIREIDEAKSHLLGRKRSAAQSNAEIADSLASDWLWYGRLQNTQELAERLARIQRKDVLAAIDAFTSGTIVLVGK